MLIRELDFSTTGSVQKFVRNLNMIFQRQRYRTLIKNRVYQETVIENIRRFYEEVIEHHRK